MNIHGSAKLISPRYVLEGQIAGIPKPNLVF
jgi:hypothetical protein